MSWKFDFSLVWDMLYFGIVHVMQMVSVSVKECFISLLIVVVMISIDIVCM